jgi:hypothetical protein
MASDRTNYLGGSGLTGMQRAAQSVLSQTPSAFDYSELEEKYPTQRVIPFVPQAIRDEITERDIERKTNENTLKRREAELSIVDAKLNQEKGMLEQVPKAREALRNLNPRSETFLSDLAKIQAETPLAFENNAFTSTLVEPLIRRNEALLQNDLITGRNEAKAKKKEVSFEEAKEAFNVSQAIIQSREALNKKEGRKTNYTPAENTILQGSKKILEQFQSQGETGGSASKPTSLPIPSPEQHESIRSKAIDIVTKNPERKTAENERLIALGIPPIP